MSDGFFYSYHLGWNRPDAESLLGDLEAAGVRPDHPVTRRITLTGSGPQYAAPHPTGNTGRSRVAQHTETQSWVTRDQLVLLAGLQRLDQVDFLLWLGSGAEVPARVRRTDDGTVALRFLLGGLSRDERETVVRAVREAIGRASVLCVGFVVDREGASAATDWRGFIEQGTVYFDHWPDTLAVRPEIASVQPQLSGVSSFEQSPWVVYGSDVPNR
ncbi:MULTISPECIES: hypothetical protein [unclassified Streptomyces]|uniref:hypothetical protein n=1 Tax=unclassified Streptomyces TaxID=2593676 RepID=UPI002255224E|nr:MULTISPECIES: hypothetical protein [unclassified Streptomyces]MCX5142564.1 hypothetical protein [Streptomyces sp. NBC_00338]WSU61018.1 hypothetical protein OG450_25650 [Streptomyces sp. NBC_01104]